jgi:hypothetical protein
MPRPVPPPGVTCMDCEERPATWRSDDGYPFCDPCAYRIYLVECELDGLEPLLSWEWVAQDRPHGPD